MKSNVILGLMLVGLIWGGACKKSNPAEEAKNIAKTEDSKQAKPFTSTYPKDTTPPQGTRYPCAFTPIPPKMEGIPAYHHQFLDRFLGLVVQAIHARLRAELALWKARSRRQNDETAAAAYEKTIDALAPKLKALTPPKSLASLPGQVAEAIVLQKEIYASALRGAGLDRGKHGKSGGLLRRVHGTLVRRFPKMSSPVKKSVFHHFCALDISGSTRVFQKK